MASMATSSRSAARLRGAVAALVVAAVAGAAWPQAPAPGRGGDGDRAVAIRLEITDRAQLEALTRLVSIDDVRGSSVWATTSPGQLERLRSAGFTWQVVETGPVSENVIMCPEGWVEDDGRSWSCYPSYGQYEALMQKLAAERPGLSRLVDLGPGANSAAPHRLWALVVSDNPGVAEDEPEVLLTSSMHGDETGGFLLLLRLAHHLLEGYGADAEITRLVDGTEVWINPLANPDGTYFAGDESVAGAIRFFATPSGGNSFVDPNRNFPDPEDGDHPDGRPWWPETEAMMALAGTQSFVLSANLHAGVEVVNYPWDTFARRHSDDAWFRSLARDWADLAQEDGPAGYMRDLDDGITNGFDWYEVAGGRQDYMTFFHGGREVTIELSAVKLFPADQLEELWTWNRRALLDFIDHAQQGIRGLVTDREGRPLAAQIEVVGLDSAADRSAGRTDPTVGDYHRLLLPGLYDLRFSAPGYQPQLIEGIAVVEGSATQLDVVLHGEQVRRPGRRMAPLP